MKAWLLRVTPALILSLPSIADAAPFKEVLKMQGIVFNVESPNSPSGNTVWIVPSGLTEDSSAIRLRVSGVVTKAQVADLNKDGSPEIYVSVNRSNGKNTLVAYAANSKKSLSQVTVPEVDGEGGYFVRDVFNVTATGMRRDFQTKNGPQYVFYSLRPGANGWLLSQTGRPQSGRPASAEQTLKVPEIRSRTTGELEVLMPNGGVLLYSSSGKLIQKGGTVSNAELRQASSAVASYLREQQ